MDAHVRDICHETHVSVDQEVSLEVAQGSKIWICRTIFRCTVRTHVVRGDCFPLNLHGRGDNYIHITNIDYNTWGRCGINMAFNFWFIIGDELKTEKKNIKQCLTPTIQNKCYHKICVHCTLLRGTLINRTCDQHTTFVYSPIFTNHIWSWLLCTPVIVWKSVWKDAKITCKPPHEKATMKKAASRP